MVIKNSTCIWFNGSWLLRCIMVKDGKLLQHDGKWLFFYRFSCAKDIKTMTHESDMVMWWMSILFNGPWFLQYIIKKITKMKMVSQHTVGTPYNTNVGVQKIPDRAIWKPVVAKRNNTNPLSCSKPQILVTRDSRQVHMAEKPASRDRLGVKFSLHHCSCIHHRLPDNSLISVNL